MRKKILGAILVASIAIVGFTAGHAYASSESDRTTIIGDRLQSEGKIIYDANPNDGLATGQGVDDIYLDADDVININKATKDLYNKYRELYKKVYGTYPD